MEPMALGSPPSSPASPGVAPNFLPSFLMGDSQPVTPNPNISPGRNRSNLKVSFSSTPTDSKNLRQKLFSQSLNDSHLIQSPYNNLQMERSGPPKQGLFDIVETKATQPILSSTMQSPADNLITMNDSYSRVAHESMLYNSAVNNLNESINKSAYTNNTQSIRLDRSDIVWVTVFGFPPSATSLVLAQLMNCGCIIEKKFPTQGNWIHLRYSSAHEAAKALALNGKLISSNIMIGIVPYANKQENKENIDRSGIISPIRARALRHSVVAPQNSNTVIPQNVPQKSTGLVTKAMEYVFGW